MTYTFAVTDETTGHIDGTTLDITFRGIDSPTAKHLPNVVRMLSTITPAFDTGADPAQDDQDVIASMAFLGQETAKWFQQLYRQISKDGCNEELRAECLRAAQAAEAFQFAMEKAKDVYATPC
jgi:hypothetical protein